jgi:hypothetical protein
LAFVFSVCLVHSVCSVIFSPVLKPHPQGFSGSRRQIWVIIPKAARLTAQQIIEFSFIKSPLDETTGPNLTMLSFVVCYLTILLIVLKENLNDRKNR